MSPQWPAVPRGPVRAVLAAALVAAILAGCTTSSRPHTRTPVISDPPRSVVAHPDYNQACAPSGLDSTDTCLEVTLQAIDNARAAEGVGPMALPADFARLPMIEQILAVVDAERIDRGLPGFAGLTPTLNGTAEVGAHAARLPPDPGPGFVAADTEWIGAVANGLDADYEWMYDDGPGSGVPNCSSKGGAGCWADRHNVLDVLGPGTLVMGVSLDPVADTGDDAGGPSLAVELGAVRGAPGVMTYTWAQVQADIGSGTLRPRSSIPTNQSATGVPDPQRSVAPNPDFTRVCAPSGLDSSAACLASVLAALNTARGAEGVKPMALPGGFATLSVPEQLLVAVDLERVDRGLPPFLGLTASLDRNAQIGADLADDPPVPGGAYGVVDTEWAGGSSNGLDAVYGWMYDDGLGSGNLDCPQASAPGCWGHRHGILDAFGTVGHLVMGAAVNETGDRTPDDKGGTSMAATLAITTAPLEPLVSLWTSPTAAPASTPSP